MAQSKSNLSRRSFLAAAAASSVFPMIANETKPILSVGLVADPQYADIPPVATRHYRASLDKLSAAIDHFNGLELDFCVNAGDTIDKDWASFEPILKRFEKSRHKFHHALGNHDFEILEEQKAQAPGRLGMEKRYYSFSRAGFCFVILDTNDISIYAHKKDAPETEMAFNFLSRVASYNVPHYQPWNGAIGPAQMKWFDETCRKAAEAKEKVLAFAHHPIHPAPNNHNAWNSDALLQKLDQHRNIVAWFNGHNHYGAFAERNGVPCITLKGMVETPDTNAFSVLRLWTDRMVLTGSGRELSREIMFRAA